MGPAQGVSVPSIVDFVFYPVRQAEMVKPVVVFTDGYAFHWDRVGRDMAQRMAIVGSGQFHVWSLSYKDVQNEFKPMHSPWYSEWFKARGMFAHDKFGEYWKGYKLDGHGQLQGISAFQMLFDYLSVPLGDLWRDMALLYGLTLHAGVQPVMPELWRADLELLPLPMDEVLTAKGGKCIGGGPEWEELPGIKCYTRSQGTVLRKVYSGFGMIAILEDGETDLGGEDFEPLWNGFLRAYNLMQFLPGTIFLTRKGMVDHEYDGLCLEASCVGGDPAGSGSGELHQDHSLTPVSLTDTYAPTSDARILPDQKGDFSRDQLPGGIHTGPWIEVRELVETRLLPLLDLLEIKGSSVPDPGPEFLENGAVVGALELAWHDRKIWVCDSSAEKLREKLVGEGWHLFTIEEAGLNPEGLMDELNMKQHESWSA